MRLLSDHCLIVLDSNPRSWGSSPFWFENIWLEQKDFGKEFAKWWKESLTQGWEIINLSPN